MIWFKKYLIEDLNAFRVKKTLIDQLGIKITEIGDDYLKASMPVDERTYQIDGILHGGATCALVETVGSFASRLCLDPEQSYSVGSQISVNHLRTTRDGNLIATCKPVHLGRSKHVWEIMVHAEETNKLIAKGELTCAVISGQLN